MPSGLFSFLYIGLTEAILAFREKHEHSKSVFMMLVRCLSRTSADSFIILNGIPSGPVTFFPSGPATHLYNVSLKSLQLQAHHL